MSDFPLILGGIEFGEFETPDRISGGGGQRLAIHQKPGNERTVDAFGPTAAPLRWSGVFLDDGAEQRCQELDAMRVAGEPVECSWGAFSYLVIVAEFLWDYEKFYRIAYSIVLEVVEDQAQASADDFFDLESAIQGDLDDVADFEPDIGDAGLSALTTTLLATAASVASITAAPTLFLDSLALKVGDAEVYVGGLVEDQDEEIDQLAAIDAGGDAVDLAETLIAAANLSEGLAFSFSMQNSLGRLGREVAAITG